jgi:hypothetical protein
MNKLIDHKKFIIYDNVLNSNELEEFYLWGQNLQYTQINQTKEHLKI